VDDSDSAAADTLAAGVFSEWLEEVRGAIAGDNESDVACGECTACCTSSQFVLVAPDETDALAHIPKALRFAAPRQPVGHVLMGYDEHGRCPMLVDNRCSIYEHRPRTCRTYDCRVFPAAGVEVDDEPKALIAQRVRRWRFDYPTPDDRARHDAVKAAAVFVRAHCAELPEESLPANSTQLAVLATQIHDAFIERNAATGKLVATDPAVETIAAVLTQRSAPASPNA